MQKIILHEMSYNPYEIYLESGKLRKLGEFQGYQRGGDGGDRGAFAAWIKKSHFIWSNFTGDGAG